MNVQLNLFNKCNMKANTHDELRPSIIENKSSNLYGWIKSLVGIDDLYIEQNDLLHDDEIIMIDVQIMSPQMQFDLANLFCGNLCLKTIHRNCVEWIRGMIICNDANANTLQIKNVETGSYYCFNKFKDAKQLSKKRLSFECLAIPCALVIRKDVTNGRMTLVLLKKYANSKTMLNFEQDINMYYDETTVIIRSYVKMLECIPAGICRISHINSTADFYIQLEIDFPKLRSIRNILKINENHEALEVITGNMYVVLNQTNNELYRAQIISTNGKTIKAKLIDYGNHIVAHKVYTTSDIVRNCFLKIPPIARKCCLKTSPILEKLSKIAEEKFKTMEFMKGGGLMNVNMLRLGCFEMVELFHRSCSISDDLISSQIEDDSDTSIVCYNTAEELISSQIEDDRNMSVNSFSYCASMDDNELALPYETN